MVRQHVGANAHIGNLPVAFSAIFAFVPNARQLDDVAFSINKQDDRVLNGLLAVQTNRYALDFVGNGLFSFPEMSMTATLQTFVISYSLTAS